MAGANNETLRRRLTAIAGAVAGTTIAAIILVYVVAAYDYETHRVENRAELAASEVSKLVYARPQTWMFQDGRISELEPIQFNHSRSLLRNSLCIRSG